MKFDLTKRPSLSFEPGDVLHITEEDGRKTTLKAVLPLPGEKCRQCYFNPLCVKGSLVNCGETVFRE